MVSSKILPGRAISMKKSYCSSKIKSKRKGGSPWLMRKKSRNFKESSIKMPKILNTGFGSLLMNSKLNEGRV